MAYKEDDLYIEQSHLPDAGSGLFTKVAIQKGERICRYKGKVTTWDDADHMDGLNPYIYYINDDYVIDAHNYKKSFCRYANDARGFTRVKGFNNNAAFIEEGNNVYIDATKNISANSEIFVGYGKEYWDTLKKNLEED